ncbi:MAG: hypothetical protein NWE79_03475 [Candidatus Bathyarchaeota archaeon]|nr:hypothetical protein [Candidatus Bathyarchaeota archaeon]
MPIIDRVTALTVKTLSAPWLTRLNWDEFVTLLACIGLDVIEYALPMLMAPLMGDILDLAGIAFCVFFFSWIGFVSLVELVPGLDVLPNFTITWLIWYLMKREKDQIRIIEELERWR